MNNTNLTVEKSKNVSKLLLRYEATPWWG